ncbi:MAG: Nif3-like dinuclear metal center hexameric protein [Candidatus Cloacimonetes bacterium]|nr:Nif3-like dinuclear metal center hexameric protein [Candidatus Cloacimonadota bacterium]
MNTISRDTLTNYLDELLHTTPFRDVAVNGLQFPGKNHIAKIGVATDATEDTFLACQQRGIDYLFVHHGIFWTYARESAITEIKKRKLKLLFDQDLSLFASHIPLDMHPEVGNNISLLKLLNLEHNQPLITLEGETMGVVGSTAPQDFFAFCDYLESRLGPVLRKYQFNSKPVQNVGIITGQGQAGITAAPKCGFDTFITGEMNHYSYHTAKELGLNIILAGHYLSETLGVKAVGQKIANEFQIPFEFLDFPTGL